MKYLLALLLACAGCVPLVGIQWSVYRGLQNSSPLDAGCHFTQQDAFTAISNEVKVLHEIDTICGDTWCCGDWDFKFSDASVNGKCWQHVVVRAFINRSYDWDGGKLLFLQTNAGAWSATVQSSTFTNLPWMVKTIVYNDDSIKNCKMSQNLYDCLTESFNWAEARYESKPPGDTGTN